MNIRLALCAVLAFSFFMGKSARCADPIDINNRCDYVILVSNSFAWVPAVSTLNTHRHNPPDFYSCIFTTSEVTNSFGGANDVEKIRNFVVYAYQNWKIAPSYLLLIGDALMEGNTQGGEPPASDYTINPAVNNFIPTVPALNEFWQWHNNPWFANDGAYVYSHISGQKKPIMHIGRIPVRNSTQLNNAIEKIIYYDNMPSNEPWLNKILMLVGDANVNADNAIYGVINDQLYSEEFSHRTPAPVTIYSSDYMGYPNMDQTVTAATRSAWNSGYAFVNAFGNTTDYNNLVLTANFFPYWAPDSFTQNLSPNNRLPVVFAGTCLVNYFYKNLPSSAGYSISEDLLLREPNRGAVAVVSTTHRNDIVESYEINKRFVNMMLKGGVRNLGRLLSAAKGNFLESGYGHENLAQQYSLIGDPATNIKIWPLPQGDKYINGFEIEDPPAFQDRTAQKTSGITNDNLRIVHQEAGVEPLVSDRMMLATFMDAPGSADRIEWLIAKDLNLTIGTNMHISFWLNILYSPAGLGRITLDGLTAGGTRLSSNAEIVDQYGKRLHPSQRTPIGSGWHFFYADLSPFTGYTLQELRLNYEAQSSAEAGPMIAYLDDIRIERISQDGKEEILNGSFEDDKDENGTPDYWTNLLGQLTTNQVQRRSNIQAPDGSYYMQVFDQWCNGEGAQHIFHANRETSSYSYSFKHHSPNPTPFRFKVINVQNGTTIVNRTVNSIASWQETSGTFINPAYGQGSVRIKLQIQPQVCTDLVYIDDLRVNTPPPTSAEDIPSAEEMSVSAAPNPFNAGTSISYRLRDTAEVRIDVYDIRGALVRNLYLGTEEAGRHEIRWDGKDDRNAPLSAGIYFVKVQGAMDSGNASETIKVSLVK